MSTTSKQFSDPRLIEVYDSLNALGADAGFWLAEVERLSPTTIIDLGCGTGLLTCELVKRGYKTVGIDPAGGMLEIARKKPHADEVRWIEGGYEKMEGLEADLVLMTSHVAQFFLDDKEWEGMLQTANDSLTNGGHFLFDSRHSLKESFKNWPTPDSHKKVNDPALGPIEWWSELLETTDKTAQYTLHYLFLNTGEELTSTDKLIFRSEEEIKQSLSGAGFSVEQVYGDWDGRSLNATSPEMIFLAKK